MIIKDYSWGKHIVDTVVAFGTGDIEIIGHHTDDNKLVALSFHECDPGIEKIGKMELIEGNRKSDSLTSMPVILTFTNSESIDSIIKMLKSIKKRLNTGEL